MIRDKTILIKNIYYMLSYAFNMLKKQNYEYVSKESFNNIHNLFAAILVKGIGKQVKQGLYRQYINKKENLPLLKGKIDIRGTVKNKVEYKQLLSCNFDELDENNIYNQILKTTAYILINSEYVNNENKNNLKKIMLFFSNVDRIDPFLIKWSNMQYQRNNQSYIMLIGLCRFVIEGMLLNTEKGVYKLANFIDDKSMAQLYEKFVLNYYIKEFPQIKAKSAQIPWALDDDKSNMLPTMTSDIMLTKDDNILIIDTKYYSKNTQVNHNKNTIYSAHLYQIFSYVKNEAAKNKSNVSGILLYAKTDDVIQAYGDYSMSGNRISARTLDLNQDFEHIETQLKNIVKDFLA